MSLNLEDLTVDSFDTEPSAYSEPVIVYTVLYETEQISCGGTCRTCNCWA